MTVLRRQLTVALAAVLALSLLSACTTTQSASEQWDDATIQTKVKTALTADRFSNITNVDINVTNGIVTLSGEVPDSAVRMEAEREARQVAGVRRVINNLQVSGDMGTGTPRSDTDSDTDDDGTTDR